MGMDEEGRRSFSLRVPRERIAYITKTFEALGHLALVTTTDRQAGLLRVSCDVSTLDETRKALAALVLCST